MNLSSGGNGKNWAGGAPCWAAYNAAITAAETYNGRLQPSTMQATGSVLTYSGYCPGLGQTGNLLDLTFNLNYGSGDNGDLIGVTNNRDTTRSQNFGYDVLNRIAEAQTTSTYSVSPSHCWGESYQFDNYTTGGPWGNLTAITPMTGNYTGCTQESGISVIATAQNQISNATTYGYDTAGNMTANGSNTYTYDAENHLASTAGVTYIYDGDGKRVEKAQSGTVTKIYWYGTDGNVLDETDGTGSTGNSAFSEYVYLNSQGQRIARRDSSNNAYYYGSDHLGTSRVLAEVPSGSTTATLCYDADFYPFGGERVYTNSCTQTYKFTGKERDPESGLDNFAARYDSSSTGRFMSPDPLGGQLLDPQTLNKYSYARNDPGDLTDPTGLYTCKDDHNKCQTKEDIAFEKARQQALKSKDPKEQRAAKSYGNPTKDNGVTVQFGNPGTGRGGATTSDLRVDPNDSSKFQAVETVTIRSGDSGESLVADVTHEGSHVADAQEFAATIDSTGAADQSKNLTTYQTELNAYLLNQSVLTAGNEKRSYGDCGKDPCILGAGVSAAQALENINRLLALPESKGGYNVTPNDQGPLLYPSLTIPK